MAAGKLFMRFLNMLAFKLDHEATCGSLFSATAEQEIMSNNENELMKKHKHLIQKRVLREVKAREKKENKILRAAERVFVKRGFDGTRMEDIAKASGLPKPNIYYYFKTKKDIYRRIIAELHEEWSKAFEEISSDREPKEALTAYIKAKLRYSKEHPIVSKIFAGEIVRGSFMVAKSEKDNIKSLTADKCEVIQAWIDEGKMDPVDPAHFLLLLWSATQFYADFDQNVKAALGVSRLSDVDYADAEKLICHVVLGGCGLRNE